MKSELQGGTCMFAYGGVRAMFLGLKTIFWGSKICNMNLPIFFLGGGRVSASVIFA